MQHKYVAGSVIICRVLKESHFSSSYGLHCIVRICVVRILLVWKVVLFLSHCFLFLFQLVLGVSVLKLSHNG